MTWVPHRINRGEEDSTSSHHLYILTCDPLPLLHLPYRDVSLQTLSQNKSLPFLNSPVRAREIAIK